MVLAAAGRNCVFDAERLSYACGFVRVFVVVVHVFAGFVAFVDMP